MCALFGRCTRTGTLLFFLLPVPSSPNWLSPHASTLPVVVSARVWNVPDDTDATLTPRGRCTRTGTRRRPPVCALPSCPWSSDPQASSPPAVVTANIWPSPAAIAVTNGRRGSLTHTGTSVLAVLPLPSWPTELSPQARTRPSLVSAIAAAPAALTPEIRTPRGRRTKTGALRFARWPLPSWPEPPAPHVSTLPVVVSATTNAKPMRAVRTLTPLGSRTFTGRRWLSKAPFPSWPSWPEPQVNG